MKQRDSWQSWIGGRFASTPRNSSTLGRGEPMVRGTTGHPVNACGWTMAESARTVNHGAPEAGAASAKGAWASPAVGLLPTDAQKT